MYTVWPTRVVADLVLQTVREERIDTVRTFMPPLTQFYVHLLHRLLRLTMAGYLTTPIMWQRFEGCW